MGGATKMKIVRGNRSFNRVTAISWRAGGTHTYTHVCHEHPQTQLSPLAPVSLTKIPCRFKEKQVRALFYLGDASGSVCRTVFIKLTLTPANIQRAKCLVSACNLSMFMRQGPLMDALCKRPAGSCSLSSWFPDMMILCCLNMKPGTTNRSLSHQSMQNWFSCMDLSSPNW